MNIQNQRRKTWSALISHGLSIAELHYQDNIRYNKLKLTHPFQALKLKVSYAKWFAGNIKAESFI